jgi:hypothetical protein
MMAYFSNGTEGDMYYEQWCSRCMHDKDEDCPIWAAHLLFNSDGANNPDHILHMLIPRCKDGIGNEMCALFIEEKAAGDLFGVV